MAIDFGKLAVTNSADTVIPPRDIFSVLPQKAEKYEYPRDVQAEVWQKWFDLRSTKDLVIKMNTGGGKTVVGLLILKSSLNEGFGPAVYVAPDPYLVSQVMAEGKSLGLELTEDPESLRFISGKAILVISIKRLINGKSIFGVGDEGIKIQIGSLIIDDAHACLATAEQQFTMELKGDAYDALFALFRDALYEQSETRALEVEEHEPFKEMRVPYWTWIDKNAAVAKILYTEKEKDKDIAFTWPLLSQYLPLCRCVLGEGKAEISPPVLPIAIIPAISAAKRRIFMSATLADDGVLVSHFDLKPDALTTAITPSTANDIGDRMIFVPQELNPAFNDTELKAFAAKLAGSHNVVVLVPSHRRAGFWADVAALTLKADNLQDGIEQLKHRHVGLVVIVNRYDGIDLPQSACRVLILDGLPDVRRRIDRIEEGILRGSQVMLTQRMQRIEQGMGRGIRSSDDYCIVFLIGRSLTHFLYVANAREKFTAATQSQIKLSDQLSEQLRDKPLVELESALQHSLTRNPDWVKAARSALVGLSYNATASIDPITAARREAFNKASIGDFHGATQALQKAIAVVTDPQTVGWLKAELAEYLHFSDPVESQAVLKSAISKNTQVLHPIGGILYQKLVPTNLTQAQQCSTFLTEHFATGNKLILAMNALLEDLVFQPETAPTFEEAFKNLALFLGFRAHRPENDFGKGPDVLWEVGGLKYFVIECKNGATNDTAISKYNCNQLNGSMNWFLDKYDASCSATALMVHPTNVFEFASSPHSTTRIINPEKMNELKRSVRSFFEAVSTNSKFDPASLGELLQNFQLTAPTFLDRFSIPFVVKGG